MMRRIISDAQESDEFQSIMRTLYFRLQACHAAGSRGSAGISGLRALILCRNLLIEGPECVLTYCTDFIPMIRGILHLAQALHPTSSGKKTKQQQALDYMSMGSFVDPSTHAQTVLDLIIDHKKLLVQRKVCLLLKRGAYPFLTTHSNGELRAAQYARTEMLFTASYSSSKLFPRFDTLHQSLNQAGQAHIGEGVLFLTPPELAVGAVEDRQNGAEVCFLSVCVSYFHLWSVSLSVLTHWCARPCLLFIFSRNWSQSQRILIVGTISAGR
jgi:hypothetical protein